MDIKGFSALLASAIQTTAACLRVVAAAAHARSPARPPALALTVVRDQALAGPQQQVHLVASCLDELDGPGVRDALRGLAVDLHDLISHLSIINAINLDLFIKHFISPFTHQ